MTTQAVSSDFLAIADGLTHLDPVRTYPQRGAKLVADLAHASGYRVELAGQSRAFDSTPPPDMSQQRLSLPLRHGRRVLGTLHLYLPQGTDKLDPRELRLARWGARTLARGLSYASRMMTSTYGAKRSDVRSRLDRSPLTRREKEVVELLVGGASTRQIARSTGLTVATVHTYLKRIYSKLGVHSRVELVACMAGTVEQIDTPEEQSSEEEPSPIAASSH